MTTRTAVRRNARNRRTVDPSVPKKVTPAVIVSIGTSPAVETIQLTFDGPVLPSKLPGFRAGAGGAETVLSMNKITETVVELVFSGSVAASTMVVSESDPGIRTSAGGFVPAGNYAIV